MKNSLLIFTLCICSLGSAQTNEKVSTLDFVEIVGDNRDEALYYYENNWRRLRETAIEKGYIESFQLLENNGTDTSFDLVLITNYSSKAQYDQREEHFGELIRARGDVVLLNAKQPDEFRKVVRSEKMVRHF